MAALGVGAGAAALALALAHAQEQGRYEITLTAKRYEFSQTRIEVAANDVVQAAKQVEVLREGKITDFAAFRRLHPALTRQASRAKRFARPPPIAEIPCHRLSG